MKELSCSAPESRKLLSAYQFELLDEERAKEIEAHVVDCQICADEFYEMLPLTTGLKENWMELLQVIEEIKSKRQATTFHWLRNIFDAPLARQFAGLAAAFVMLVTGVFYVQRVYHNSGKPVIFTRGQFELLEPGVEITSPPKVFVWDAVVGAKGYGLEVIDSQSGAVILSGKSQSNSFPVDDKLQEKFQPDMTYRWEVRALDASGNVVISASRDFTILKLPSARSR